MTMQTAQVGRKMAKAVT